MAKTPLLIGPLLVGSLLLSTTFWLAPVLLAGTDDPPKKLEWRWSKEKASLEYCVKKHLSDYEVELVREKECYTPINIRSKNDRKLIYAIDQGHMNIVFARSRDILYLTDFSPIATGCTVIALDLKSGKKLWTADLQGLGPIDHFKYSNAVNIEIDGHRVVVYGNEDQGLYVEHLDIKTGKTLANKRFELDRSLQR